jgi:hypothetical protein
MGDCNTAQVDFTSNGVASDMSDMSGTSAASDELEVYASGLRMRTKTLLSTCPG